MIQLLPHLVLFINPHGPPQPQPVPEPILVEDTPLVHNTNHIEDFVEDFITLEDERSLLQLLESETFT